MACYLIAVVLVIGVISTYEVRTFSCNGRAIGQYCMKDLSGYYECKIIPKTDFKRYVIRKCSNEKRCSCDQAAGGCTRKICVNIASAPVNKRPRMSLSFTGSVVRWGWGNDAPREEQLEGEVFEDVHNKYYLKRLWKTGTPITDEKFELIRPEKNGDLIKVSAIVSTGGSWTGVGKRRGMKKIVDSFMQVSSGGKNVLQGLWE